MFAKGIRRVGKLMNRDAGDEMSDVEISELDGVRALHLGSVTVQSAMRISAPFDLELNYSRAMMSFLLFNDKVRDILIIGLGGGSIPKFVHHYLPPMRVTTVELNPAVIAAARNHFMLPQDDERLRVIEGDGIVYVQDNPESADVLMLDAFGAYGVAPGLTTQSFYDSSYEALSRDGILIANLWGSDKNFDVYLQRIEQACHGRVLVLPTGLPGNILVFGFKRAAGDLRWKSLRDRAKALQEVHPKLRFLDYVERLKDFNLHSANRLTLG